MVDVSVRKNYMIDFRRLKEIKAFINSHALGPFSLKETAFEENFFLVDLEEMHRSGYSLGSPDESKFHSESCISYVKYIPTSSVIQDCGAFGTGSISF